jgi:hypothetical protein
VIEPAKGEYRKVFGGLPDVSVFGVNPNLYPLLRINPFAFPKEIFVLEHIERLLGIFSACWPLYAAMPAILKEALESVYKKRGYDLVTGEAGESFPTFSELVSELTIIVKNSHFAGDVEGNYIAALVTRVRSLATGLYANIFSEDEIDEGSLFNTNTIIDISRVGSAETKSLIMGILIMRLQEHHMAYSSMNSPLKHLTLLEEAHNLLRGGKSIIAQGESQVQALSIEMITSAIADMRTYGEGFVIADQSPSAVDLAVMRNTNAKVSFKLPERGDREMLGDGISLDDEQIRELARLERGVAAVFQNDWNSALLCKCRHISEFSEYVYVKEVAERTKAADAARPKTMAKESIELASLLDEALEKKTKAEYASFYRRLLLLVDPEEILKYYSDRSDMRKWDEATVKMIEARYLLTLKQSRELISRCLLLQISRKLESREFWVRFNGLKEI